MVVVVVVVDDVVVVTIVVVNSLCSLDGEVEIEQGRVQQDPQGPDGHGRVPPYVSPRRKPCHHARVLLREVPGLCTLDVIKRPFFVRVVCLSGTLTDGVPHPPGALSVGGLDPSVHRPHPKGTLVPTKK